MHVGIDRIIFVVAMDRTERHLRFKGSRGSTLSVVRELYLRDNVPCQRSLCIGGCENTGARFESKVTHYILPDTQIIMDYLEIIESSYIRGIIITHTVANNVQHEGGRRHYNRLRNMINNPEKDCSLFHNEFQKYCYCEREPRENIATWQSRSNYQTAEWMFNHLAGQIPIVMMTENSDVIEKYANKTINVFVMNLNDYLLNFCKHAEGLFDLYMSVKELEENKQSWKDYSGYLSSDLIHEGIKQGQLVQGCLNVNKHHAMQEAFIKRKQTNKNIDNEQDIFIFGVDARNRAVHSDIVIVKVLPKSHWKGRSQSIVENQSEEITEPGQECANTMPTGHVVAVVQRNWRDFVVSISAEEETQSKQSKGGKILAIPWDYRIPKIRINTKQVEEFRDQRIVARIDSWPTDSQYPNGHFVRSLGKIGDIETEIAALLVENELSVGPFAQAQLKELPTNSDVNPWQMKSEEMAKRRDLRDSHLIFSIDPKGCEDVDDTLSIQELDNGHLELGVHIADVTYFVAPGSLTDLEAKSRSTSVYLADRRYDMLPPVLSADLCSLLSDIDRYAMSVIWELDENYKVVDVWFGRTIIRSRYKLFYEIAQAINDGVSTDELVNNIPELRNLSHDVMSIALKELKMAVTTLMKVARHLKAKRTQSGALELESAEVQIQLDDTAKIQDIVEKGHLEIHETIAECMIFANHWVAKKITEAFPNEALLRHHPLPRENNFDNLRNCAKSLGFCIDTSSNKALAESLDQCVDPLDPMVNKLMRNLATQAMSNASYFSTGSLPRDQFFHYGLALDYYTHFTSPIRRYADVIVHRLLLAALGFEDDNLVLKNTLLDEATDHINQKHRAAQNAQRDSQDSFLALYFKDKGDDDEFCIVQAVIFQLRDNGILVFVPRYGTKGPLYLRTKDGQVVTITNDELPEWTSGSIARDNFSLTVTSIYGYSHTYKLFDRITVRILLKSSHAHSSSLRFELLSHTCLQKQADAETTAKDQKAGMIRMVAETSAERREKLVNVDLGSQFAELKEKYGQTNDSVSVYAVFEKFKQMGLLQC